MKMTIIVLGMKKSCYFLKIYVFRTFADDPDVVFTFIHFTTILSEYEGFYSVPFSLLGFCWRSFGFCKHLFYTRIYVRFCFHVPCQGMNGGALRSCKKFRISRKLSNYFASFR